MFTNTHDSIGSWIWCPVVTYVVNVCMLIKWRLVVLLINQEGVGSLPFRFWDSVRLILDVRWYMVFPLQPVKNIAHKRWYLRLSIEQAWFDNTNVIRSSVIRYTCKASLFVWNAYILPLLICILPRLICILYSQQMYQVPSEINMILVEEACWNYREYIVLFICHNAG